MRRDDLMKPDLLSDVLLLASGIAIVMTFVLVAVAAFTHAAAVQ
jgi:hypothetical protein